jgi:hypothetical protein
MLYHEFNMDKALAVSREEGREEGMEKVFSLLESGVSLAEAKRTLGLQNLPPTNPLG